MSLLINENIEMPTNCRDCPLDEFRCLRNKSDITMRSMERGRHPDCPLVEVPEHGRLIDADALIQKMDKMAESERNKVVTTTWANAFVEIAEIVWNAPTVIESEKKGNNEK